MFSRRCLARLKMHSNCGTCLRLFWPRRLRILGECDRAASERLAARISTVASVSLNRRTAKRGQAQINRESNFPVGGRRSLSARCQRVHKCPSSVRYIECNSAATANAIAWYWETGASGASPTDRTDAASANNQRRRAAVQCGSRGCNALLDCNRSKAQ